MRSGAVPVRLAAMLVRRGRMLLSPVVAPAIVVVRGLAMMVRGRLMMSSGVMMVLARNVLLFGLVHGFSP
jgi:hypothetical protein